MKYLLMLALTTLGFTVKASNNLLIWELSQDCFISERIQVRSSIITERARIRGGHSPEFLTYYTDDLEVLTGDVGGDLDGYPVNNILGLIDHKEGIYLESLDNLEFIHSYQFSVTGSQGLDYIISCDPDL